MNQKDLDLAMTNIAICLPTYKEETRFHNSEIVILDKYTIDKVGYNVDKGEIRFTLKELEKNPEVPSCSD